MRLLTLSTVLFAVVLASREPWFPALAVVVLLVVVLVGSFLVAGAAVGELVEWLFRPRRVRR